MSALERRPLQGLYVVSGGGKVALHALQPNSNHLSNDQTGPLDPWTREVGDREAGHREVGDRQVGYREVGDQEVGEVGDLDPGPLKRRVNAPFSACACFFSQSPAVSAVPTSRNSMAGKVCEKSSNHILTQLIR